MLKYVKLIDEETGLCDVGLGTNNDFYKSIGMTELDVEQSKVDNNWYLRGSYLIRTNNSVSLSNKNDKYDEIIKDENKANGLSVRNSWIDNIRNILNSIKS